jgi:hypothetical protein
LESLNKRNRSLTHRFLSDTFEVDGRELTEEHCFGFIH